MPIMGNHDDPSTSGEVIGQQRSLFHRIFTLPEPSLGEGYYAFTAGSVRFIALNTESDLSAQTNWLARELQAAASDTNIAWIVATGHRPPYSWGEREGEDSVRTNFSPLLVRYEADLMISGHSHNYQRTIPIRGVRYLVAGGGGGRLYTSDTDNPTHAFATTCYHHASIHVTGEVMQVRGIRSDGLVFDRTSITHHRHVRVEPAFPRRGEPVTIRYRASEGPLAAANPVYLHIGQDEFASAFADVPMTWNATSGLWEHTLLVPITASNRLAFVFHNAENTIWHNNYDHNWQVLLDRVQLDPALPMAGSNLVIRYEADMGLLAGAGPVGAWISWNRGQFPATGRMDMINTSGAVWQVVVPAPAFATEISIRFTAGNVIDDDYRRGWSFPVSDTTVTAWPPAPLVAVGSPDVTDKPTGGARNHVGDNMDFFTSSPPVLGRDLPAGFGDWGSLWLNYDATNLYLGAHGMNLGGSNNVFSLFLGIDTLTDNAWNLWHKSGLPNTLDTLHNLRFTEPMDVAIVIGDQFGDRPTYTNFTYAGYNFGQGIYYIGTNAEYFVPITDARLSQFDGEGQIPCVTTADAPHRWTMRWEARLPWSALGAAGPQAASNLFLAGVIASSSVKTSDRYVSRVYLGDRAWGSKDSFGQYGYHTVILRPVRVNFLHADLRGDGIPNQWRWEHFGTPDGPDGSEDSDRDGMTNHDEFIADTDPRNSLSLFRGTLADRSEQGMTITWSNAAGRIYGVTKTTNLLDQFQSLATGLVTGIYTDLNATAKESFYQIHVQKAAP
jgi:hypothetical protein